jgi:hypothetical protein
MDEALDEVQKRMPLKFFWAKVRHKTVERVSFCQ